MLYSHDKYMQLALAQAEKAGLIGEVPVGAVLLDDKGRILAAEHNRTIERCDPSAHAEILALRAAAAKVNNYRLSTCTLYATLEPCLMCMGALVHARIATVVYGAQDIKWGAAGSLYNFAVDDRLNHRIQIVAGVCQEQCREIIQAFFRNKRRIKKQLAQIDR
jgi:tRNA(adenine34) deaminase